MMKKHLFLIISLFTFLTTNFITSEELTIEGEINFAFLPLPSPGLEVQIYSEDGQYHQTVYTNLEGLFSATFDLFDDTTSIFIIETKDPCTGDIVSEKVQTSGGSEFIHLLVCRLDDFPCHAHFEYFQVEGLSVHFLDLSAPFIESRLWDFGDGQTSADPAPIHRYDTIGTYMVTLSIMGADSCRDSTTMAIRVDEFPCHCPEYYLPVCGVDSLGQIDTFSNPCFAACAGIEYLVSCIDTCDCSDEIEPICLWTIEGELTFINACHAICAGYDTSTTCDTGCFCPEIYDPVCAVTDVGDTLEFPNICYAHCAGYDEVFSCRKPCNCDRSYKPVCVDLPSGEVLTFDNACLAECEGYTDYLECDTTRCVCDTHYDPVCFVTEAGDVLRFSNLCEAECRGYPEGFTL